MPILLGIAFIIAVVIVVNYAQQLLQKQLTRSSAALAAELGLTFSSEQQPAEPGVPGDFLLFAQGIPHSRANIMEGLYKGVDLAVYSYTFAKDLGKVQELITQTVIQIRSLQVRIPQFNLLPQEILDSVMNNLPSKESKERLISTAGIRTPNHPDFRKKYKLIGYELQKLSSVFDSESVITALHSVETKSFRGMICMEGAGQNLFIYPLYNRVPLKYLTEFLDKSINLAQRLESVAND